MTRPSPLSRRPGRATGAARVSCAAAVLLAGGCAAHGNRDERLPTFARTDERSALALLAGRARAVRTLSAQGSISLARPGGQTVRLDAAVALRPPDRARVRAWKFGQAVFDLTLNPDGAWLYAAAGAHREQAAGAGASAAQIARAWSLLGGSFFADPQLAAVNRGDHLVVRRSRPGEPAVVCTVDRATLIPRKYEVLDDDGAVRFTLTCDRFADLGDNVVWPRILTADSGSGRAIVELREIDPNPDLPDNAFVPPRRAGRLP